MATIPPKSFAVRFSQFVTQANTTAVNVPVIAGNTTVNSVVNATSIVVQSATSNVNLTANGLVVGTAVANGTTFSVGNSTVNATHTATSFQAAGPTSTVTVNNSNIAVGANVIANTTAVFIGNSTVNTTHTATSFQATSTISTTVVNNSVVAVGANVIVNTSIVAVGNSTISSYVSAASIKTGGTLVANGSQGTAGQVLTSSGSGNAYWSSAAGGGGANLTANTTTSQTMYLPMSNTTTGAWTNAVVDTGLTFVPLTRTLTSPVVVANVAQINVGNITTGNVSGSISFGSGASNIVINSTAISISGSIGNSGQVLSSTGTGLAWANAAAGGGGGGSGTTTNALEFGVGLATDDDIVWNNAGNSSFGAIRLGNGIAHSNTYTVVGATGENYDRGAVYIYNNTTGALHYKISGIGGYGEGFGGNIAINGNYIAVSATNYSSSRGRVYVFNMGNWAAYSGSTVSITSADITLTNPMSSGGYGFGTSLSMSSLYLAIGAPGNTSGGYSSGGMVYVYDLAGTLKYTINNPTAYSTSAYDYFGQSVALGGAGGATLVVGAPYEGDPSTGGSGVGKLYVFTITNIPNGGTVTSSNYTSYGYVINNPDPVSQSPQMGTSVAFNGIYIIAGAPYRYYSDASGVTDNTVKYDVGAVYVFDAINNGAFLYKIDTPNPITSSAQNFGQAVAVNGSNLIVGEPNGSLSAPEGDGAIYLYELQATKAVLKKVHSAPNLVGRNITTGFGQFIAISNNYIAAGSPGEQTFSDLWTATGAVHLYTTKRTFNGSNSTIISLAKTSVKPGVYGSGDSYNINIPQMAVDRYGRINRIGTVSVSLPQQTLVSTFSTIQAGGASLQAINNDVLNIAAGNNVTITADSMTKTITISSTGGSSAGGGGGALSANAYFMIRVGPSAVNVDNSSTGVTTTPAAQGQLFIGSIYVSTMGNGPATVQMISGQSFGPMNQYTGQYAYSYGPSGPEYPWYSMSPQSGSTNLAFTLSNYMSMARIYVFGWILNSSSNPQTMTIVNGNNGSQYLPGGSGDIYVPNYPQNNGIYINSPDWCYGTISGMGGPLDFSNFTPASGVSLYYDASIGFTLFRCPPSIWATGSPLGAVTNAGSSSYVVSGYYFGT